MIAACVASDFATVIIALALVHAAGIGRRGSYALRADHIHARAESAESGPHGNAGDVDVICPKRIASVCVK
jgi:hypothetical protein